MEKNLISLRTYAIPEITPTALSFSAHMLRFQGLQLFSAGKDLIWGVQGTGSLNRPDAFASMDAQHKKRSCYQMDLSYKLRGVPPAGASITAEFAVDVGYLHFTRLTSAYRKALHEEMLSWLAEANDLDLETIKALDFDELVKTRPMLIHQLMGKYTNINTVVHVVALSGGALLRIATVRNIPQNIKSVVTRYYEHIVTTV